uniref:BED-type domain-containing protein n=1 Tax=Meloidogyne enterolobii TaxID=390850 RepID=A0A6V7WUP6_MELEN|nr:unnamed protein product [Meloidogyne enterolobii]
MQTANQQNNSSITPLSDPGSSSSSSSTQQNLLNENSNIGQQITYPPPQLQYLLANLAARNQAASNPSLAAIVANMQLSNLSPPPEFRLPPAFNFATAVQQLIRNAVAAASNNQINNSGLLLRQQSIGNPNNIVGYPQIKEENSSTGTDSPERHLQHPEHQNLYGVKGEDEEKFLVDLSIVMEEEDVEEGQEENENIEKTQQSEQQIENVKTTQRPIQRRPRVGGSSAKTAEVWRFFSERPNGEKAATCSICQKTIKATNSSTTGMIRHLKSCHVAEHKIYEHAKYLKALKNIADDSVREQLLRESGVLRANNPHLNLNEGGEENGGNSGFNSGFIQTSEFSQQQQQTFNNLQQQQQQNFVLFPKQHSVDNLITTQQQQHVSPTNVVQTNVSTTNVSSSPYSPNISSSIKSNNSSGIGSSLCTSSDCCNSSSINVDTSSFSSFSSPSDGGESSAFNHVGGIVNSTPNEQQQSLSTALLVAILQKSQQQTQQKQQQNLQDRLNQFLSIPPKKAKRGKINGGTASVQSSSDLGGFSSIQSTPFLSNTIKRKGAHVDDIVYKLSSKAAASLPAELKKESEEMSEYSSTITTKKAEKKKKQKRVFVSVQTQTDDVFEIERNEKQNSDFKGNEEEVNGGNKE